MASLIQLKQIESSSALITAAEIGGDFSQSVIDIVTTNVQAILPTGVISSSAQLTASFDERYVVSGSITQTNWDNIVGKPTGIISGASQLDGATLKNITITTDNADMYSLIVSGAIGVVIRRNSIVVFMCIELMLNAANLAFVTFSRINGNLDGQVVAFFTMVVAACEVVVGLAIIVTIFRSRRSASIDDASLLNR